MEDVLTEAKNKSGENRVSSSSNLPGWLNPKQIQDGQDFIQRNFFSVFFAHFISLIFLLCYAPVRRVLMKTGKSDSASKSFKRYLSTLLHIQDWYEGDLLNLEGRTYKDIQRVRRIHSGVSRSVKILTSEDQNFKHLEYSEMDKKLLLALRSELQATSDRGREPEETTISDSYRVNSFSISQLDMIVTQFCFMGFILLFPQKFGISPDESNGLNGFVHLWAVIGHLLGIDDRYNICLEKNRELMTRILYEILLPDFQKCHPGTLVLWKSLISGLSRYASIPFLRLKAVLVFIRRNILDLNGNSSDLNAFLSKYERFCYKAMSLCFSSWLKLTVIRKTFNALLRFAIWVSAKKIGISIKFTNNPNPNNFKESEVV